MTPILLPIWILPEDVGAQHDTTPEDAGTTTGDDTESTTDTTVTEITQPEDTQAEVNTPEDVTEADTADTQPIEPEPSSKKYEVKDGCAEPLEYASAECSLVDCADNLMCVGDGHCVPAGPFLLGDAKMTYNKPAIADATGGRFAASWYHVYNDNQGTKQMDIYFQLFSADGSPVIDAVKLDDDTLIYARSPSMVRMGNGGFLVIWRAQAGITSGEIKYMARVVAPDGTPKDAAFQLNQTALVSESGLVTNVDSPFARRLRNSNLALSWMGQSKEKKGNADVFLRVLNPDGSFLTDELPTGADTAEHEGSAVIADTENGGLAIFWTATNNPPKGNKDEPMPAKTTVVKGRIFDQFAVANGEVFQVTKSEFGYEGMPSAATFENGEIYVTWKTREKLGTTSETAIWGVQLGPDGQDMGKQQLKAGFDPQGYYPFYAPVGTGDNERAFLVWHTIAPVLDGIYMRRYYKTEDIMDCEITNVSGELMAGENGVRIMPAIQSFEDGRTLISWGSSFNGKNRMMVRYLK
ncbi:MAG TPA: hypothetical protein EYN66_10315 [Myxococcales bacterium]|nr:hypothetical protein [Myxococcales bacterium]